MSVAGIGFDRALRLDWLDLAAGLAVTGTPRPEAQRRLVERLGDQLEGAEAAAKTALVLVRPWYPQEARRQRLRDEALALVQAVSPAERLAVHWGLLLAAYPFFRDAVAVAGRLLRLQPQFRSQQMRARLVEHYGDRAFVERARRHVVRSLVHWEILTMVERNGVYALGRTLPVHDQDVERFLLHVLLLGSGMGAAPLDGLLASPELFPFAVADDASRVAHWPGFSISTVAGQQRLVSLAV